MTKESEFQNKLIKRIEKMFPDCIVLKNDPTYKQGVPDLSIFYGRHWATLECKRSANAGKQPNQEYYVGEMDKMSFSRIVYPENVEEVLHDLQQSFKS